MARIPVSIQPDGGTYWLCPRTGEVWTLQTGGTAWPHCAVNVGHRRWRYTHGYVEFTLQQTHQPVSAGTVSSNAQRKAVLGLRPAFAAVLEYDKARCKEIGEAILRYAEAMQPVPQEWLDELSELTERNQPENQPTTETLQ